MGTETNSVDERNTPEYLAQLLKDKTKLQTLAPQLNLTGGGFIHVERLLDEEINKVRVSIFNIDGPETLSLPDPVGEKVKLTEKIHVPVETFPKFNFIGKILGPRGTTAQTLEKRTGCKIMIRGRNSMRKKEKEDSLRGKQGWEHLDEPLHVLIAVEDTKSRAEAKMSKAKEEVHKLLVPVAEGEDVIKKVQLIELAMINGTYRDQNMQCALQAQLQQAAALMMDGSHSQPHYMSHMGSMISEPSLQRVLGPPLAAVQQAALRSPTSAGTPLILAPRMTVPTSATASSFPPPLVSPTESHAGLMYTTAPYEYPSPYGFAPTLVEYPPGAVEASAAGAVKNIRQAAVNVRQHPYSRVPLA